MNLLSRLDAVLSGGWPAIGAPPLLWPGDRRLLAQAALDEAGLDRAPRGPGEIARALNFSLHCLPGVGECGGEGADGRRILYRWSNDARLRRARVAHGLAHGYLVRRGVRHSEADALLMTLDFLCD